MSEARAYGAGIWCAIQRGMRFVLAFVLLAHGVAHLVGFVSSWKLATLAELPYKTTRWEPAIVRAGTATTSLTTVVDEVPPESSRNSNTLGSAHSSRPFRGVTDGFHVL